MFDLEFFENLGKADVEAISDEIWRTTNSTNRLRALLEHVANMDRNQGYQLFKLIWPTCDDTIPYIRFASEFLHGCRDEANPSDYLTKEESHWYDALPRSFRIYRGADTQSLNGLSWTTSKEVALQFARGHRGIFNQTPVLLSGYVRKPSVLMADNSRDEFEILTDFENVSQIRIVNYVPNGSGLKPRFK